jgi:hypothetical protein
MSMVIDEGWFLMVMMDGHWSWMMVEGGDLLDLLIVDGDDGDGH